MCWLARHPAEGESKAQRNLATPQYNTNELGQRELPLVYSTWLRTHWDVWRTRMPKSAYFAWARSNINRILAREPVLLAARDVADPVYVYGWCCAERVGETVVVHYANVKSDWREGGIATALLHDVLERIGAGAERLEYTHETPLHAKLTSYGFRFVPLETHLRRPLRRDVRAA